MSVHAVKQRLLLHKRFAWQLHADELASRWAVDVKQHAATAKQVAKVVKDGEVEGNEAGHRFCCFHRSFLFVFGHRFVPRTPSV